MDNTICLVASVCITIVLYSQIDNYLRKEYFENSDSCKCTVISFISSALIFVIIYKCLTLYSNTKENVDVKDFFGTPKSLPSNVSSPVLSNNSSVKYPLTPSSVATQTSLLSRLPSAY